MNKILALFVSGDASLSDAVRMVINKVGDLCLQVLSALDPPYTPLYRSDLGLVILHLGRRKSDFEGMTRVLQMLALLRRRVAVIIISDQLNSELALELTRQGAAEYLQRPLDLHRLGYLADSLTIPVRQKAKHATGQQTDAIFALGEAEPFLFAQDTAMGRVIEKVLHVAPQDTTILLTGETGSGKSRLTRLIHELSPRREEPFLVVNCGALSANLMESELFGHLKGAFTGADRDRVGKCAEVGRGTLVLDEIDTLTLEMQVKLLRVVEDRVFEPVGSNRVLELQARLIAGSNRDHQAEMANGRFRSDLYYRLNVVEFRLLALRVRPMVLRPLAQSFLSTFATKVGRTVHGFSEAALQAMQAYHWPGNVRELRNLVEGAVALSKGSTIELEELPVHLRQNPVRPNVPVAEPVPVTEPVPVAEPVYAATLPGKCIPTVRRTLARTKQEAETTRIVQALAKHGNNRQRAAAELNISRMTLYNKLHRYGLIEGS